MKDVARGSILEALLVASFGVLLGTAGCTVADPTTPLAPTKESGVVGPAGGHLTLAGADLDVPPNAVGQYVTITVSSDAPKPETHLVDGLVYRFEPAGLVFSIPITVSFPTAVPNHFVFWTRAGSNDTFEPLATSIEGGKTIAHPTHFSHGLVGEEKAKPNKKCEGARDEACGNCGTRTRTCNDGVWSDWGACESQGACTPNAIESCDGSGTRTCGSRCQWEACEPKKACEGPASEACGNCGTRTRTCGNGGKWSEWSACTGEGVCELNATEACGTGGTRTCVAACQWGSCSGQACAGASTESCGNCGTRTRSCDNGTWSSWSVCTGEGICAPNATQACGTVGTQTCNGTCQWGGCTDQTCAGPASQACGNCGTQTRSCNSGVWSSWAACSDEGVCAPNATQACGTGGTQACTASCTWGACTEQTCAGPSTQGCGNCGTQTRSCNNGVWSGWSACSGEGVCAPNATQACGTGGTQTCTTSCQWAAACTGETCAGLSTQSCGTCGTQSRTCSNGLWSSWSTCVECACSDPNACPARPHATPTCGAGTCGFTCEAGWEDLDQDASNGCEFDLSSEVTCIKKRRQTESCVGDTCTCSMKYEGTFHPSLMLTYTGGSNFGALGGIEAGDPEMGAFGKWTPVDASRVRYVGFNPSKSYVLRTPGGRLDQHVLDVFLDGSRIGSPPRGCEQVPVIELRCRGRQKVYSWYRCEGPTTESCGNCGTHSRMCTEGTGVWSEWSACTGEGVCSPNAAQACGTSGSQTCNPTCQWDACTECVGPTTQACGSCGTQSRTCQAGGVWSAWSTCSGEGGCVPGNTRACGATGTQTCNASCGWEQCSDGSTHARGRITVGPNGHACAIRPDGTLACWGDNDAGQATPPAGTFRQVSAGYRYTCGLRTDGTIACWGANAGNNATPPGGTFEQIDTGSGSCAIRADGTVLCWGAGGTLTAPPGTFREVSVGSFYACGIRTDGTATCWTQGTIGTDPSGTFEHVSVGEGYACGLRASGAIDCWGTQYGAYYQERVPSGTFRQIEAGSFTACGVRTDDTAVCWGINPSSPPAVPFREVSMGVGYGCGIGMSGTLACWPNGPAPPSGTF